MFVTAAPPMSMEAGALMGESSVNLPPSSAAASVTTLNVEPGVYSAAVERSSSSPLESPDCRTLLMSL